MEQPNWQQIVIFLLGSNTQEELSEKTGIKQSNISRIKNGKKYEGITYNAGMALKREYNKALKVELDKESLDEQ